MKKGVCKKDCNSCPFNDICGGCSICEMPFCKRDCKRCFALCPKRKGTQLYIKSLLDKDFLKGNENAALPSLIPVIPNRLEDGTVLNSNIISVHPRYFFSSNGEKISKTYLRKGIKGALNLNEEKESVLHFYTVDRLLEGFYDKRKKLYEDLRSFNFKLIISPNFSVYEDAPRMDHIANILRSRKVYNEMLDKGLRAAPDISWYSYNDLDMWLNLIHKENIQAVSMSFQTVGTGGRPENLYINYGIGFRYFAKNLPEGTDIILAGISSPKKLKVLLENTDINFHVLNQAAFIHSRKGELSGIEKRADKSLSKDEIFLLNLKYYEKKYEEVRRCQNQEVQEI